MRRVLSVLVLPLLLAPALGAQDASIPATLIGGAPAPTGETVRYVPGDTATRGYLAVPRGAGPFPAVILVHEWNGLVDRVRQVADLLAQRGFIALAADMYQGRTGSSGAENRALMRESLENPDGIIANLDAAQRYLRARPDVTGKVGVMGWCYGGGVALSYGLGGAHHDATAIFYGSLITDPARLASMSHPVYGTFAGQDRGIPVDGVRRLAAVLDSLGVQNDIHIYDPVQHGFWLWVERDRETNEAPALDAWNRLERFLRGTLGGR